MRKNKEHGGIESAIDKAITDMPEDFILKSFLVAHRTEVKGMLVSEYNETEIMELFKVGDTKSYPARSLCDALRHQLWHCQSV